MPEKIKPGSPEWAEIDSHMYMLNLLLNPQVFFDQGFLETLPHSEREALIGIIKGRIQEVIDE